MQRFRAERNGKAVDIYIEPWPNGITSIGGIALNKPDHYIISVNENAPDPNRSLGHELAHVFLGHLDDGQNKTIAEMEQEANREALRYFNMWESGLLNS